MACPFCDIRKQKVLKEYEHVFVILSDPRLVPGHILVIPKKHVEKLSELNEEERKELFDTIITLQEEVVEKFASGCDISQHYRPFISQSKFKVNHIHFHLRPRESEDELYNKVQKFEKDLFQDLPQEEFEKFKKLFL